MDRLLEWVRRIWYLLNRRRIEAALREEMEAHRAEVKSPARFGNVLRLREEARDVWGWNWLDDVGRDLRLGVRTLRRSPGFALSSTAILSLGIGINLAFFQLVNVALLQPLRVKDPQTLAYLHYRAPTFDSSGVPYPVAMFVRDHPSVLSAVLVSRSATVTWGDAGDEALNAEFVSAAWFDELGASAAAGRLLHAGIDDEASAPPVVVLSDAYWQRNLGGRPDIVGRTVHVNGRTAVVAGVVGARFPGLQPNNPQVWMPIERIDYFEPGSQVTTDWATQSISMYGRLRPGVSLDAARDGLRATLAALANLRPDAIGPGQWLEPASGSVRFMFPQERRQTWAITTAAAALVALVLMIACLNLSNLSLARAISRMREMSVRTALGAGRWRVMRHLAAESALLVMAGTGGGWFLAWSAASIFAAVATLPSFLTPAPDWRSLVAAAAIALVAMFAMGFAPVWKIGRQDLALATRDGGERASHGLHAARLRYWLVAGQIAGSCVLLVFAAEMARSLQRVLDSDQGFNLAQAAVLEPPLGGFGVTRSAVPSYWNDVRAIVGAHPEVARLTLVTAAPLGNGIEASRYRVAPHVWFRVTGVDTEFFPTLQIPIVAGRAFAQGDTAATAVIVSRRGALEMYGTLDVLGQGFPKGQTMPTIVGVAGDARLSKIQATDMAELYRPVEPGRANAMIVQATGDPARVVPLLRDAARVADPRVMPTVRLMRDDFDRALRLPRLISTIAGAMALAALALASVGIFGLVSYGAGLRTKEIGIRLALGARAGSIVRMLLRHSVWSGLAGGAIGLIGGWAAGRAFAGDPFYLQPLDVAAYVSTGVTLLSAASLAAILPAWRIVRRDPLRALRDE